MGLGETRMAWTNTASTWDGSLNHGEDETDRLLHLILHVAFSGLIVALLSVSICCKKKQPTPDLDSNPAAPVEPASDSPGGTAAPVATEPGPEAKEEKSTAIELNGAVPIPASKQEEKTLSCATSVPIITDTSQHTNAPTVAPGSVYDKSPRKNTIQQNSPPKSVQQRKSDTTETPPLKTPGAESAKSLPQSTPNDDPNDKAPVPPTWA